MQKWLVEAHGIRYSTTAVTHMLDNERYIGRAYGQDDFCPPIIDGETFATVQRIRSKYASRSTKAPRTYLFSGLLICAECGRRMGVHNHGGTYNYYRCSRTAHIKGCQNRHSNRESKIEEYLLDHIEEEFAAYNLNIQRGNSHPPAQIDSSRIKFKMSKLKDLYLSDLIDREEYERDYTQLRQEFEAASAISHPARQIDLEKFKSIFSAYVTLDREHKKAFWSRTIERITADSSGNLQIVPSKFLLK